MTPYQRHLYSNRLRRCPKRVAALTQEIIRVQKRATENGREPLSMECARISDLQAQKNRLMDRHAELLSIL